MNETASMETMWLIRDSRGLTDNQKIFLVIVASRGTMFSKWSTAAADMGMKKDKFYSTRKSLIEADLLNVTRQMDGTTVYSVNIDVLRSAYQKDSGLQNGDSVTQNEDSDIQNKDSGETETKVTIKTTIKGTKKIREKEETLPAEPVDTRGSMIPLTPLMVPTGADPSYRERDTRPHSVYQNGGNRTGEDLMTLTWERLDEDERQYFSKSAASDEQKHEALTFYRRPNVKHHRYSAVTAALAKAGYEEEDW